MTRIVHLTDLHFGRERGELVAPLHDALREVRAELLVVTGDLAHRARRAQFRRAMAFLRGLDVPFMALPGNHDVPLFNPVLRFLAPFLGWRRSVAHDLTPSGQVGRAVILSANTADPFRVRRGILRRDDIRRIGALFRARPEGTLGILACHHPLRVPPGYQRGETRNARAARPGLIADGLQVVLSGHLHDWSIGLGITPGSPQPVLYVGTGTALCARPDERDHGFSVLDIGAGGVAVTPWIIDETSLRFRPREARRFVRRDGLWHPAPAR